MTIRFFWLVVIPMAMTCLATPPVVAGDTPHDLNAVGAPVRAAPADPAIAHALAQISARRIEDTIDTLVGFGTRHTLSSMIADLPEGHGVNAAADWIEAEFKRYAEACYPLANRLPPFRHRSNRFGFLHQIRSVTHLQFGVISSRNKLRVNARINPQNANQHQKDRPASAKFIGTVRFGPHCRAERGAPMMV